MTSSMFDAPGRFYRGNLHTHSTNSDGALPPEEVCRRYARQGYDFISLTDHFVGRYGYPISDTTALHTDDFVTILGAELHSGANSRGELWHLLAVGLPADFEPSNSPDFVPVEGQETGPQIARRARDAGAFVAIAHPHWSVLDEADALSIEAAHAVEVFNTGCDVACDRGYGLQTLDFLLNQGRRLMVCATDDAHFIVDDQFGGWVMVKAESNTPQALLEALKNGFYYSSQGPDFADISFMANHVSIACSTVDTIIVQGQGSATVQSFEKAQTGAKLSLDRLRGSPWVRISLIDADGKRAWSNPYWLGGDGVYS